MSQDLSAAAVTPVLEPGTRPRRDRVAGAAAVVSVAANFAALLILVGSGTSGTAGQTSIRALNDAHRDATSLWAAAGLRCLGLAATVIVAVRVIDLVGARSALRRWPRTVGVAAPVALIGAAVLSQVALSDAADKFTSRGPHTEGRADHLLHHGALPATAAVLAVAAAIIFAGWLAWTALALSRVGLTTTFLGYFGVGAAVASVVLPVAGQGMVIGWVGSVGLLLLGWWPGGRGPSWTTGEAAPLTGHEIRDGAGGRAT